jgi:lipopolysaccharide transport system permease protein
MTATTSVVSAAGIVKNVAFKTELLPIAGALTGLVPLIVALSFLAVLLLADGNVPTWHALLLPIVIALHFALIIGFGVCLAAFNVFFRDLSYALPNLLMIALFATPIFYPIESMPTGIRGISRWNPFYVLVEAYRNLLVSHTIPELLPLVSVAVVSAALLYGSVSIFRRLKGHFDAAL